MTPFKSVHKASSYEGIKQEQSICQHNCQYKKVHYVCNVAMLSSHLICTWQTIKNAASNTQVYTTDMQLQSTYIGFNWMRKPSCHFPWSNSLPNLTKYSRDGITTMLQAGWPGVQFPSGARDVSSLWNVQTCSMTNSASYSMGTTGYFSSGKVARAWSWPFTSI